jgi:hypothetical protein
MLTLSLLDGSEFKNCDAWLICFVVYLTRRCIGRNYSTRTHLYSLTKQDVALRDVPGMYDASRPIMHYIKRAIERWVIDTLKHFAMKFFVSC